MEEQENREIALMRLDPRQRWVIRIHALIGGLIPFLALIGGDFAAHNLLGWPQGWLTGLGVLLYVLSVIVIPGRRWRRWGYHMGEDAIRIASGWLVRRETIVPFARVQHIDVSRGPIERSFGVATLTLHTAGSYNSTVALPGLAFEEANRIREEIRAHIREDIP